MLAPKHARTKQREGAAAPAGVPPAMICEIPGSCLAFAPSRAWRPTTSNRAQRAVGLPAGAAFESVAASSRSARRKGRCPVEESV